MRTGASRLVLDERQQAFEFGVGHVSNALPGLVADDHAPVYQLREVEVLQRKTEVLSVDGVLRGHEMGDEVVDGNGFLRTSDEVLEESTPTIAREQVAPLAGRQRSLLLVEQTGGVSWGVPRFVVGHTPRSTA